MSSIRNIERRFGAPEHRSLCHILKLEALESISKTQIIAINNFGGILKNIAFNRVGKTLSRQFRKKPLKASYLRHT
jgi:hypothetical protein